MSGFEATPDVFDGGVPAMPYQPMYPPSPPAAPTVDIECVWFKDESRPSNPSVRLPERIRYYTGQVPREGDIVWDKGSHAWDVRKVVWNLWYSTGTVVTMYLSLKEA